MKPGRAKLIACLNCAFTINEAIVYKPAGEGNVLILTSDDVIRALEAELAYSSPVPDAFVPMFTKIYAEVTCPDYRIFHLAHALYHMIE